MPAVSLRGVSKEFPGVSVRAVHDVSFDVDEGEFVVILGPSGCGKTTTLRMIAGLEEPDTGEISIGGKIVSSASQTKFVPTEKRNIGMVFQNYAIWPHMSVFNNVGYPLRVRRTPKRIMREKIEEVLELVGLSGLERRSATQLSGGQQQRVALARSLVFGPQLLLLDEPLSNLDAKLRLQMRTELRTLQRQTGIATVFVTHDQTESMVLADRIIVMNKGKIEQVGKPQQIYESPRTRFVSEFVGSTNLLPGAVAEAAEGDGLVRVKLDGGTHEALVKNIHGMAPAVGEQVLVFLRPEKLTLHSERPPGTAGNVWNGRVESSSYFGTHREYEVQIDGHVLKVNSPADVVLDDRQPAYITCETTEILLLRAER